MALSKRWGALEYQLPLAAAALFLLLASALAVVAYNQVRSLARDVAEARLARLADDLSASTSLSVARFRERITAAAVDPAIIEVLRRPETADREAAGAVLRRLPQPTDTSSVIALWDLGGEPLLLAARTDTTGWFGPPDPVDSTTVTPIQVAGDSIVFYGVVSPIRIGRRLAGFVQHRQRMRRTAQTERTVATLLGGAGQLLFGTPDGVWTDMGRSVEPPDLAAIRASEPVRYRRDGAPQLGIGRPVTGTPWVVLTEMPESAALAPTRGFLLRMALIGTGLALVTALAAGIPGRRITRPLATLRDAADAIRAGALDRRAVPSGHRDIREVSEAFNAMAESTARHLTAVQESEERFRSLVTATAQIVWWTDAKGNMVDPAPSWRAFTGQSVEETAGVGWTAALHPDDAGAALQVALSAIEHRSLYETEYRIRRHDGEYRWFTARGVPVLRADGSIREWVTTGTDITERREAEEKLRRKEAELNQAQRLDAIGRLAGGIAHDFNNLLTAIIGPAELAADQLPSGHPVRQDLKDIRSAAHRAGELTRQLLAFGRQQVLNPAVLDLNEVVEETSRLLRRVIGESILLDLSLGRETGRVRADRTQLGQVIINLVVNARDAMPDGGRLTIETRSVRLTEERSEDHTEVRPGPYVLLAVTDTGIGMSEETRDHLFEPFFTTKEQGKGTGLGLATVYGIVRQSGGHIWVYSELGQGSSFTVYFPEAVGPLAVGAPAGEPAALPTGTETILLTEDEPALLELGSRMLRRLGYTVLAAPNGDAALALMGEHGGTIDLLVSDVVMPGMNGLELWERLKMTRPGLPALFLSGWASEAVVRHGILEGQVPFLQKPYTASQLGLKVREALDRHRR